MIDCCRESESVLSFSRMPKRPVTMLPFLPFLLRILTVALVVVYSGGCSTTPEPQIATEDPYNEYRTAYAPEVLANNLVSLPTGAIALPPDWRAARRSNDDDHSVVIIVNDPDNIVTGRFEIVDIASAAVSIHQARYVYEQGFRDGWTVDGRFSVAAGGSTLLMIRADDGTRKRVGFFRSDDNFVYVADFILNTGNATSDEELIQQLYDYMVAGDSVHNHFATARLRHGGISFLGVRSGFEWIADTVSGVVLAGRIDRFDLLFEIDRVAIGRSAIEGESLPKPVVRHRLIGNQAALLTIASRDGNGARTRYFGTIEVASAEQTQRYDIVVTVRSPEDTPEPGIDSIIDNNAVVRLVRDELLLPRR